MGSLIPDPIDPALQLANKYSLNSKNVVSSAYWKVPDSKSHLTSVACHQTDPLVAVASGTRDSNLFIYEVSAPQDDCFFPPTNDGYHNYPTNFGDDDLSYYKSASSHRSHAINKKSTSGQRPGNHHSRSVSSSSTNSQSSSPSPPPTASSPVDQQASPILTHHQTISLGGIHSLAWVSSSHKLGSYGNVLATGHNSGLVHLVLLPDPYADNGPAEIISRFNHSRHISSDKITSSRIRTINLASSAWTCCPQSSIISLFSEHLFMWDPARKETPIVIQRTRRARSLNISPLRNGIVSLATDRGISIMDVRYKNPVALAPPNENDGLVSLVKWSALDENRVASVHDQTLIKIWDIRTGSPLVSLEGHYDKINSIEWSATSADEFYSASADGTVRIWDIKKCTDLNEGYSSTSRSRSSSSSSTSRSSSSSSSTSGSDKSLAQASERRKQHSRTKSDDSSADWLPSKSWRLYRQRLARENSLPSYNYFLDNQNPMSPCTTIFSNNKEFIGLATVKMPVHNGHGASSRPHLVSIDNSGFFGIHTKIVQEVQTPPSPTKQEEFMDLCKDPYGVHSMGRRSFDSLASLSSKSANDCDLDHRLDDSVSDTSSHSTPSSPRTHSRCDSTEIFTRSPSPPRRAVSYGAPFSLLTNNEVSAAAALTKPLFIAGKTGTNDTKQSRGLTHRLSMPSMASPTCLA